MGLQVHRRRAHPDEYAASLPPAKRARWTSEEINSLAAAEAELIRNGVPRIDYNYRLMGVVPGKSLEAMKGRRKDKRYRILVAGLVETMAGSLNAANMDPEVVNLSEDESSPVSLPLRLSEPELSDLPVSEGGTVTQSDDVPSCKLTSVVGGSTSNCMASPAVDEGAPRRKATKRPRLSSDKLEVRTILSVLRRIRSKSSNNPDPPGSPPNISQVVVVESSDSEDVSEPEQSEAVLSPSIMEEISPVQANPTAPESSLHEHQESILNFVVSLLDSNDQSGELIFDKLRDLTDTAKSGSTVLPDLNKIIAELASPVSPNRSPSCPDNAGKEPLLLSKKALRRQEYATTQKRFFKHRSRLADEIIDGSKKTCIKDPEMFVEFWADLMASPVNLYSLPQTAAPVKESLRGIMDPVTVDEVLTALKSPAKAAGPDGVTLRRLASLNSKALAAILNFLLYEVGTPEAVQRARLAFIPKEKVSSDPGDFRPIAVGSYIQRILHRVLASRIGQVYEHHPAQRAFIAADGCQENLGVLSAILEESRRCKKQVHLASVDIRKAFDTVYHGAIEEALLEKGFPSTFIHYLMGVYNTSRTVVEFGGAQKEVKPTRGVRQGDPLSPFIFNLVIDHLLESLDVGPEKGFSIAGRAFKALAFADDMIFVASSRGGLQSLLDQATSFLKPRGLHVNPRKCFTLSLVPRRGRIVVENRLTVKVDGIELRALKGSESWKYLGIQLDYQGRIKASTKDLETWLSNVTRAPLKPQQRLILIRQYVIPRILHRLLLGPTPTASLLEDIDNTIRLKVKYWLRLPQSSPVAFLYASQGDGGLGIPCLRTLIPRIRCGRIDRMRNSSNPDIASICEHPSIIKDYSKTQALGRYRGVNVDSGKSEKEFWRTALTDHYDGVPLKRASDAPFTHNWVRGNVAYLSGREYTQMIHLRINALPVRARLARGRPNLPKTCRIGCPQVETIGHLGICPSVADVVSKRHNDVVLQLARYLHEVGLTVRREVVYRTDASSLTGSLRPDLVINKSDSAYVLDVQIVGPNRNMMEAAALKERKYNVPIICDALKQFRQIKFGGIIVNTSGVWHAQSVALLSDLGLSKSKIQNITCMAMQGTLRVWRAYNAVKRVLDKRGRPPQSAGIRT